MFYGLSKLQLLNVKTLYTYGKRIAEIYIKSNKTDINDIIDI